MWLKFKSFTVSIGYVLGGCMLAIGVANLPAGFSLIMCGVLYLICARSLHKSLVDEERSRRLKAWEEDKHGR